MTSKNKKNVFADLKCFFMFMSIRLTTKTIKVAEIKLEEKNKALDLAISVKKYSKIVMQVKCLRYPQQCFSKPSCFYIMLTQFLTLFSVVKKYCWSDKTG